MNGVLVSADIHWNSIYVLTYVGYVRIYVYMLNSNCILISFLFQMDHIPFSQLISLTSVHQYIEVLSISHGNLNSIKEVLVEKAAEIRPAPTVVNTQNMENWRIVATTKLPDKRLEFKG